MENLFYALILAILLSVAAGAKGCISGCAPNYSQGERFGQVTQFSSGTGLFLKSHEGSAILGTAATSSAGEHWQFSVVDDAVATTVAQIMASGCRARLTYHEYLLSPARIESKHVVTAAKCEPQQVAK